MSEWISEKQTSELSMSVKVKETLYEGQSNFQTVGVYDTNVFGRMLVLDGVFQTSIFEEYVYHEMIAHIPLFAHPDPKKVLIIGGGDGVTAREVLLHTYLEKVDMIEIDGVVVEQSKKHLPEISKVLNHPPANFTLTIGDGLKHI